MANITQRTNKKGEASYLIRVFMDEKSNGKQTVKSMTYKPDIGMTQKQIEKKLNEVAVNFEQKVKKGIVVYSGVIKFEDYAARWMEAAQLAPKTRETYHYLLVRINQAIGHIRLENIQPHHLQAFYKNLKEKDISNQGRHAVSTKLIDIMKERHISRDKLAEMADMSPATAGAARNGKRISIDSAKKIAAALNLPLKQVFTLNESTGGLSDKSVIHHHRLLSAILATAKRERIISFNVAAEFTTPPRVQKKEARYLDDSEAKRLVELLLGEDDIRIRTSILLALYSGVRRGELCGLSWDDIDEKSGIIHVLRASQYQERIGIVEVPTKNESSMRAIKLPAFMFEILGQYKK